VKGTQLEFDLAEPVALRMGDLLLLENGDFVEVVAEPEPLIEARAKDLTALARLAWHLGDRHVPVQLFANRLRVRRDPAIEALLARLGAKTVAIEAPFDPESSAKERCRAQAVLWLAEGLSAEQVAETFQVSRQTVYNWVNRFLRRDDLELRARLLDAPRPGRPPSIAEVIDPWIAAAFAGDPRESGYHATVWTAELLQHHLEHAHGIKASVKSISLAIARLGLRWKRPRHELAARPETWRQAKGG
jgi:urease accessory protein UreE